MINQVKESDAFNETEIESLETLASQGNLSGESHLKKLIEKENLTDEDPQD